VKYKQLLGLMIFVLLLAACAPDASSSSISQTQEALSLTQTAVSLAQDGMSQTQQALSAAQPAESEPESLTAEDFIIEPTEPTEEEDNAPPTVMDAVVSQTRHFIGDPGAPVVIIEFSDFQ
jgi:protein-disulfide isomerase